MRTKHTIKNIGMSVFSQVIIILLGFISRKVFLDSLGTQYLGINGLLTNVLSAMLLIEGGFGISIVYNLYKPLAEDDTDKIIALIQLYKKVYTILAFIMLIISIILYPYLNYLMKSEGEISGIGIVYSLLVLKNAIGYIYGYKWALINADQRGYYLAKNNLIFQIISMIGKIVILKTTNNYIAYLFIEFIIFVIQNISNSKIVNKRYPYIKTRKKYKIDKDIMDNINSNVRAMFIQNIGSYAISSTDNIIISAFINVSSVGLYSNYSMIINQLYSLVSPIVGGIGSSVGNLIALEDNKKRYSIFKVSFFMAFWIYSFSVICLFNLVEPFIRIWLGNEYLLDKFTFFALILNFYISGMRSPIGIFKNRAGLFAQDKYAAIVEGIVNLFTSIILIRYFGLAGVFLGTAICFIVLPFWNQPRIVYKHVFNVPLKSYFYKFGSYIIVTIFSGIVTTYICNLFITDSTFLELIFKGITCLIIPNIIYLVMFYNTEEFKYLYNILIPIFNKIRYTLKLNLVK